jgi:predicted nucleotidyltransferase
MNQQELIQRLREQKRDLYRQHQVRSLQIFGSYVHGDARPDSDLDVLVEFEKTPGLFEFVRLQKVLTRLLGVKVDLVMKDVLRPRLREQILREAISV